MPPVTWAADRISPRAGMAEHAIGGQKVAMHAATAKSLLWQTPMSNLGHLDPLLLLLLCLL